MRALPLLLLLVLPLVLVAPPATASILPGARATLLARPSLASQPHLLVDALVAGSGGEASGLLTLWSTGVAFVITGAVFAIVALASLDPDEDEEIQTMFLRGGAGFAGLGLLFMTTSYLCWAAGGAGGEAGLAERVLSARNPVERRPEGLRPTVVPLLAARF